MSNIALRKGEATEQIETLVQFVEAVNSIVIRKDNPLSLKKLSFRGQSRVNFELSPALARVPSKYWATSWTIIEEKLIRCAQQRFPTMFPDSDYPVTLLAKLQHYGIYTRMLDVTENALVALYFACNKDRNHNGEVIVFQTQICSAYDIAPNVVADTYRLTEGASVPEEIYWYRVLRRPYAVRLICPNEQERLLTLSAEYSKQIAKPFFVEVGNLCERQRGQGGRFILFPNQIDDNTVCARLTSMGKDDDCVVKRLIIEKAAKKKICSQLEQFGITKEFLFPDNVDNVLASVIAEQRQLFPAPKKVRPHV